MRYWYVEMDTVFLSSIIITLDEHGINKTLEILSTEVMTHIMANKDNFYSSFKKVSKLEDKKESVTFFCEVSASPHEAPLWAGQLLMILQ